MQNKSLFSRFLTSKKVIFIVSVILAFVFWILTADNITKTFTEIPIRYSLPESISKEFEIFGASDETVSVTVEGKRVAVDAMSTESFTAYVDLSDVTEAGEKSYNVSVRSSENLNIDISRVEPSNITLMIDKPLTKSVPLKTDFTYHPDGYYVDNNAPEAVEISGPESYVKLVKCAYISGNVSSNSATSVTNNYKLTLYDNINPKSEDANVIKNEFITLSYDSVDVTFRYLVYNEGVPFGLVNEENIAIPEEYYTFTPGNMSVAVPVSALDKNGEFTSVPVDMGRLSQFKNETYNFTVDVAGVLTGNMVNKSDGVDKITYRLDFSTLIRKTIEVPASGCQVINMPDGFTYNKPDSYSIVVIGTRTAVDSIDPNKVDMLMDFSAVEAKDDIYVDVPVAVNLNVDGFCWAYRQSPTSSVRITAE